MTSPTLTEAQARELARGEFGRTLLRQASRYIVPFQFASEEPNETLSLAHGTGLLIRTPRRVLLVTAKHVVEEGERRAQRGRTEYQLGNVRFPASDRLVSKGTSCDLATFEVTEADLVALEKQALPYWPPRVPSIGGGVLIAGYPQAERQAIASRVFSYGIYVGLSLARSVDERQIATAVEHESIVDTFGLGLPPPGYHIGGMSGGPLLTLIWEPILHLRLGGIIPEGLSLVDSIVAHRADVIDEFGRVRE